MTSTTFAQKPVTFEAADFTPEQSWARKATDDGVSFATAPLAIAFALALEHISR